VTATRTMRCPKCGRAVGYRRLTPPKVRGGKAHDGIRMPYPHDRPPAVVDALGGPKQCPYGRGTR
jgi:hypothetical protein